MNRHDTEIKLSGLASSGIPILPVTMTGEESSVFCVFDLSTIEIARQCRLLVCHAEDALVGGIEQHEVRPDGLHVAGWFMLERMREKATALGIDAGACEWQLSLGAANDFANIQPSRGEVVNGRMVNEGVMIVRHAKVNEVSLVPLGQAGDPATYARFNW